ncbi:MAG TPA: DNA-directed RNA polymerase subunit beta' [Armatimonadota bacterium]|jgi:DNA-directed RNA polymerase subunit beta'
MAESRTFEKIRIGLASPEEVRTWSFGEVKKPETINYRTFKPERDGLFCERIFGPVKDWECHCGRYKKVKFKGIVCDRCGVEVTRSKVRRERMGHIELCAPVSHIWYLKGVPSPMALLLDLSPRPLEKVIYFGSYIVTAVDKERINRVYPDATTEWDKITQYVADELEERKNAPPPAPANPNSVTMALEPVDDETLVGRIATDAVVDPETGEIIVEAGDELTQESLDAMTEAGIVELEVAGDEPALELTAAPRMLDDIAGDDLDAGLELMRKVEKKELLSEEQFRQLERVVHVLAKRSGDKTYYDIVRSGLGASAVRELLREIDLEALLRELETEISQTQGPRRLRAVKRIEIVRSFLESKSRPEWMILDAIPVIPPELRPMVQLDGGRFATSDLNDLYRRIINRNNRLKKIQDIKAPESIINHEKRLLQEAVDALIDNGRRTRPVVGSNNRPLRSLSDMLKGKEGRFRKNLLGKRVDYSGRSVIVVGPTLKLNQCGLPKEMALELFKPFVMKALVDAGCTTNIKTAKRMIDRVRPEVWDALEKVIQEHVVMLNRAPTLHRLGIQAFQPILVDGKAIRVHPLVCAAFGADFDGDQMAVHVPLSSMAQAEGQCLMLSTRNLFKPSDGAPIVAPIQDIVLGLYYLTQHNPSKKGAGLLFSSVDEAVLAHETEQVHLHAPITVRDVDPDALIARYTARCEEQGVEVTALNIALLDPSNPELADIVARCPKRLYETTMGRLLISRIMPWMMRYPSKRNEAKNRKGVVDTEQDKKAISAMIRDTYEDYGAQRTIELLDDVKQNGFTYATKSGLSISLTDMDEPASRETIIQNAEKRVADINRMYRRGAITAGEREGQVLEAWTGASAAIGNAILDTIGKENPLFMMTNSGARGSKTQIVQLSGMRGLMSDPFGGIIEELPIKSNFHRGLNILEYFVSTHGQRKGLADTALRTADAGYLTRRLVDVAQDVIVRQIDCGTSRGIFVSAITEAGDIIERLSDRIRGRIALDDIVHPKTGEVLAAINTEITDLQARDIEAAGITRIGLRSPLTCELRQGICANCYGRDMATAKPVEVGTAVGIIAAQSIGEPGTQLTMRTFHTGGVAGKNIVGVANVKQKKQEALRELHADIERGHVSLEDASATATVGSAASDRERSRAVQAMLKVLEEQVGGLLRVVELVEGRKPKGQAIITEVDGVVVDIEQKGSRRVIIHSPLDLKVGESINGKVLGEPVLDPTAEVKTAVLVGRTLAESVTDPRTGDILLEAGAVLTDANLADMQDRKVVLISLVNMDPAKKPESVKADGIKPLAGLTLATDVVNEKTGELVLKAQAKPLTSEEVDVIAASGVTSILVRPLLFRGGDEINDKASKSLFSHKVPNIVVRYSHLVPYRGALEVKMGDTVKAGDRLTEGPLDPDRVLELQGINGVQDYMVKEVQSVYKSQGVDINDKHIEVIVRQMLKKMKITDPGATLFLPGQMVDKFEFEDSNKPIRDDVEAWTAERVQELKAKLKGTPAAGDEFLLDRVVRRVHGDRKIQNLEEHRELPHPSDPSAGIDVPAVIKAADSVLSEWMEANGEPPYEATAEWLLLGITEASLATDSFLSAASFQKTTKVLADAAVRGKKDNLVGLKENVIIGRLIPAGTGLEAYHDMKVGGEQQRNILRREPARVRVDTSIDEMVAQLRSQQPEPVSETELEAAGMSVDDGMKSDYEPEV